jgi:hypothetical protein
MLAEILQLDRRSEIAVETPDFGQPNPKAVSWEGNSVACGIKNLK